MLFYLKSKSLSEFMNENDPHHDDSLGEIDEYAEQDHCDDKSAIVLFVLGWVEVSQRNHQIQVH